MLARLIEVLASRPGLQRILKNSAWLSTDKALRLAVGVFLAVWLARYLGPEVFGQYSYAIALVGLFSAFSTLGLESVLVREIVKTPEARNELLGSAFVLKLAGGCIGCLAAIACVFWVRPEDPTTRLLAAILAFGLVFQAADVLDLWFQSQLQSRSAVVARNTASLSAATVKAGLILVGAPVVAFAWAGLLETLLAGAGLYVAYRIAGERLSGWRASVSRAVELFRPGFPLILAGLAVSAYMKIDQIMLAEMLGVRAAGIYSAATRISEAVYFIPGVIAASVLPSIISTRASNRPLYMERMQRFFELMVVIAAGLAITIGMLSPVIVELLFGPSYSESTPVLAIHAWSSVFVFLGVASSSLLLAENLTAVSFYRTALGAVVNVLLNLIFIPWLGVQGAAYATLISYAVATYSVLLFKGSRPAGIMMLRALIPTTLFRK
jgi:O-antigen/teichoic acid export membrane protein